MTTMYEQLLSGQQKLAVVGLGYVGLPLAVAFDNKLKVIGLDSNYEKVELYKKGIDVTQEVGEKIKDTNIIFTTDENLLKEAGFIVVAVPTPINRDKTPDLTPVTSACTLIGRNLKENSVVVFESTVYPGVTEEICVPILEKESGLICGKDFKVGYSPERINPGDKVNRLPNIKKIVSGMDEETRECIAKVYELIIDAGVHRAESIKVAEAAKLVENAQRDINIAFMNELAVVFDHMQIDTKEVIDAMNTKWNSLGFTPGLVGGHCIGVDPHYFIYQAQNLGYHSELIAAGRRINDSMGEFVAEAAIKSLTRADKKVKSSRVYIMGVTFKEDCPDIRNTRVEDIIAYLKEYGIEPILVDPVADQKEIEKEFECQVVNMDGVKEADCIIFAVAHKEFKNCKLDQLNSMYTKIPGEQKIIIDVKSIFDKTELEKQNYTCWRL